jgi:hypothetical protein
MQNSCSVAGGSEYFIDGNNLHSEHRPKARQLGLLPANVGPHASQDGF